MLSSSAAPCWRSSGYSDSFHWSAGSAVGCSTAGSAPSRRLRSLGDPRILGHRRRRACAAPPLLLLPELNYEVLSIRPVVVAADETLEAVAAAEFKCHSRVLLTIEQQQLHRPAGQEPSVASLN